ncbi:MAG TPA: response regulator [Chloroflexia bacterium]|nr:response regulator [Chloroflexia bacterium]
MRQQSFILLVEDDPRLRNTIAVNLSARGYMVLQAGSFKEAVNCMSIKPGLMILDIHLPDASGWEVAAWLETNMTGVPVIVISGYEPKRKELARHMPAAFLSKPFDVKQLMDVVEMHAPRAAATQ